MLGILLLVWPTAAPASAATAVPATDTVFSSLLNVQRTLRGLGPLSVDGELSSIAQSWSMKMATAGAMSHNPGLPGLAAQRGWARYGENVAFGTVASTILTDLLNSPVHAGNIFNPEFTKVGIGTVLDGQGRLWTTQVFIRPGGASTPSPSPTTTSKVATATQPTGAVAAPKAATGAGSTTVPGSPPAVPVASAPAAAGGTSTSAGSPPPPAGPAGSAGTSEPLAVGPLDHASTTHDAGEPVLLLLSGGLLLLVLGGAGFAFFRSSRSSSR